MRVRLELKPIIKTNFDYNSYYHYQTFSFINKLCSKTHDENKIGKFCFHLNLPEPVKNKNSKISNKQDLSLTISSSDTNFIKGIAEKVNKTEIHQIKNLFFKIGNVEIIDPQYDSNKYLLRLRSPAVIHDRFNSKHCISVLHENYEEYFLGNLQRKINYEEDLKVKLIFDKKNIEDEDHKKCRVIKNGGKVTGYFYEVEIEAKRKESLYRIIESGLGAKNTMGFGFVDVIQKY